MSIKNGVKIASINGAEVLKIKAGKEGEIKYNTVFSNSLLLDKLKSEGLKISKQGSTKDIINVKFDYGYTDDEAKELMEEYNKTKANNKAIKKDNRDDINRIKQLNKMIKKVKCELKVFKKELLSLTDKKEIDKLQNKIDTRKNKLIKYKEELKGLDCKVLNELNKNINNMADLEMRIEDGIYKKEDIRDLLYDEGFSLDVYKTVKKQKVFDKTIEYVYFFRSAGKAKDGTDYFINKELFEKIDEWHRMGIELSDENCKLVEMEVYKSLIASAISGYITIKPSEILVMKDLDVYSKEKDVIKVIRNEASEKKESIAIHTKDRCMNTIWDGMCLLQRDEQQGLIEGFRGLRQHFYKTAGFVSDFQLYFKEYYGDNYETATITDMFGREVKVSTCKMITTNNALKFIKFLGTDKKAFEQWAEYVEKNDCKFGITKENHLSKYGDKLQRMSYQMLMSLDINQNQLKEIFKDSLNYIMKLKNDNEFFIEHLKRTATTVNNNALLADLATTYPTFINSYMFKDARKQEVYQYKETLKRGKLLSESENETILANPMTLLYYCTGQLNEYITDGILGENKNGELYTDKTLPNNNSCYCLMFNHNDKIGAFRSPQNSMNNVLMFKNNITDKMNKYFKYFGKNVIAVNMIRNDVCQRGNGLDEDLDFLYCSTSKTIVEACEKAQKFPTIINGFKPSPDANNYSNTAKDRAKVDNVLQKSQKAIGTSSNVAMLYLTQYWHLINKYREEKDYRYKKEMEDYNFYWLEGYEEYRTKEEINLEDKMLDNVCILSIIAQVCIDLAKRKMQLGQDDDDNAINNEIERLRRELPFKEKPIFWQYTSSSFDDDNIEKKLKTKDKEAWKQLSKKDRSLAIKNERKNMIESLYDYDCPMNWLLKEIDKIEDANTTNRISDENFLIMYGNGDSRDGKQAKKIEGIVEEFQKISRYLNACDEDDDETVNEYYNLLYNEYLEKVKRYSVDLDTMSLMIARALNKENKFLKSNSKIKTKLLNILYEKDRENFVKCFRDYEK